jgi:hypothetical protein
MKRTSLSPTRRATSSTTSTVGPHVRLVQNFGVANVTTNGFFAFRDSATECLRRVSSGGTRVVSFAKSPPVDSIVGVSDAIAGSPMSGSGSSSETTTFPSACTFGPPSGSARSQYVPGSGARKRAT